MSYQVQTNIGNKTFSIETGRMAKLADGAVIVSYGDSVVLTTAVAGEPRAGAGLDFLPLTVDYREKTSAAGKIPGGFFKREGRPTTEEILTMRLTDRPIRPLFPAGFSNEIQVMSLVLSAEQDFDPDILAINGASAALVLSGMPFAGPVGAVRIGQRDGQFLVNPTLSELAQSDLDMVVAGTEEAVLMVEGVAREIPETTLVDAINFAHQHIQSIVKLQKELKAKVPQSKPAKSFPTPAEIDQKLYQTIKQQIHKEYSKNLQIKVKQERRAKLNEIKEKVITKHCENLSPEQQTEMKASLSRIFSDLEREIIRELILAGQRIDGRGLKDIRSITCEVGLLPRNHGSALFTRGETQALVSATLGTAEDEQIIDGLGDEYKKKFMLHYNFPSFSVGEVRPIRGPGRREIGHGHLAERAIEAILPAPEDFPYTIRIVSDILESNGSSSMATVCGTSLCLMDAGVPTKAPVAGIAMGLVKEGQEVKILSDILGNEDKCGDMDFKIAGTERGVTAVQMDMKTGGIATEILQQALDQARAGRLFILEKMSETLAQSRSELSVYAPRLVRIKVNPSKIGLIIGPGGKTIRKIEEDTKASVEINDDGEVIISSVDAEAVAKAKEFIEKLTEEVEIGKIYEGKVTGIKDFGAFVEILPSQEGLVHISELAGGFVQSVEDVVKMGQIVSVKVLAIDENNKIRLSRKRADPSYVESEAPTDKPARPPFRPRRSPPGGGKPRGSSPRPGYPKR